jgi:hypothetical protein
MVALAACEARGPAISAQSSAPTWGPLAVSQDAARDDLDSGVDPGELVIGPKCVTLRVDESVEMTLIWRSGQTEWDGSANQIVFADRDLGTIRLSSGDRIAVSGAPLMNPDSPDQGAGQPVWIVPPDASCPAIRWMVHQVDPVQG